MEKEQWHKMAKHHHHIILFLVSIVLAGSLVVDSKPKPVKRTTRPEEHVETQTNLEYFHDARQDNVHSFGEDTGGFDTFGNDDGVDPWAVGSIIPDKKAKKEIVRNEPAADPAIILETLNELEKKLESGQCAAVKTESAHLINDNIRAGCFAKALSIRGQASYCLGDSNSMYSAIKDFTDGIDCVRNPHNSIQAILDRELGKNGELFFLRAQAYARVGQVDPSIKDITEALSIIERYKEVGNVQQRNIIVNYLKLRASLYEQKKYRLKNTNDLRRIAELQPSRDNWFELAQRDIHNRSIAVEDYKKALKFDPQNSRIYHFMGHIEFIRGEIDLASAAFSKALEINPNEEVHIVWGQMLNDAGRYREAHARLSRCAYPRSTLSIKDGARCNHMAGHAMAALGKFRQAIRHYDTAIELEPHRAKSNTGYMREFALFFHHHLEDDFADYIQDQEMDSYWLDGWSSASSSLANDEALSMHTPLLPLNPNVPDIDDNMFRIDPKTKKLTGKLGELAEAGDIFVSFYRLRSPGFLPNVRVCRGHSIAVLDIGQRVRKVLTSSTPVHVSNRGASGGCTGGFHNEENGMGVGFAPGRCMGLTHEMGWRDVFDIAVKYRTLTGPGETVHWCDTQLAHKTNQFLKGAGFGETKMADGDVTSHKYYAYFPRMFERLKLEASKFKPDNSPAANKQLDKMFAAKDLMEFMKAIGLNRYQVEMKIRNPMNLDELLPGTRICLDPSREEYGYFLAIRTMRERDRVHAYNMALMQTWTAFVSAGRKMYQLDNNNPERYELKKKTMQYAMNMVYIYINLMPLNRGSAGSSLSAFQGLLLAAGLEATNKMPDLVQPDFEALLTEDPRDYVKLMTKLLFPEGVPKEDSKLLDSIPLVHDVVPTTRHMFAALNQMVKSMPVH